MKIYYNDKKSKKDEEKVAMAVDTVVSSSVANKTTVKTDTFNKECDNLRTSLKAEDDYNRAELTKKLNSQPDYVGDRQKTVSMTWKYEKADVTMGGKGSANLNARERAELLETGKVRGCEVHHINSVAEHPEFQTSADNGRIYRSHKEHLHEGHGGDFHNPTSGPMIDRDKMLRNTNRRRVIKNEITGAGTVIAIGAATGLMSSVAETCKEDGVSFKSVKKGIKKSGKSVIISTSISLSSYIITRAINHFSHI